MKIKSPAQPSAYRRRYEDRIRYELLREDSRTRGMDARDIAVTLTQVEGIPGETLEQKREYLNGRGFHTRNTLNNIKCVALGSAAGLAAGSLVGALAGWAVLDTLVGPAFVVGTLASMAGGLVGQALSETNRLTEKDRLNLLATLDDAERGPKGEPPHEGVHIIENVVDELEHKLQLGTDRGLDREFAEAAVAKLKPWSDNEVAAVKARWGTLNEALGYISNDTLRETRDSREARQALEVLKKDRAELKRLQASPGLLEEEVATRLQLQDTSIETVKTRLTETLAEQKDLEHLNFLADVMSRVTQATEALDDTGVESAYGRLVADLERVRAHLSANVEVSAWSGPAPIQPEGKAFKDGVKASMQKRELALDSLREQETRLRARAKADPARGRELNDFAQNVSDLLGSLGQRSPEQLKILIVDAEKAIVDARVLTEIDRRREVSSET